MLSFNKHIQSHYKWSQQIDLPEGISTPGKDYSKILRNIYGNDLSGKDVLVLGCGEGLFCFEAKKRNARRVIGVDIEENMIDISKSLSRHLSLDIEFYFDANLESIFDYGSFDYTLCFNLAHNYPDPLYLISRLIEITKTKFVFEADNLNKRFSDMGKKTKSSVDTGWFWKYLFRIIPSSIQPPLLAVDSRGGILISQNWVKDLFSKQHLEIAKTSITNSVNENTYIISADLRKIRNLVIVSGPPFIGKSNFLKFIYDSNEGEYIKIDNQYKILNSSDLIKNPEIKLENVLLEYDLFQPRLKRYGNFESDPNLKILRTSENITVYILISDLGKLYSKALKTFNMVSKYPKKKNDKIAIALDNYKPSVLKSTYLNWINYCRKHKANIKFVDIVDNKYKTISQDAAYDLLNSQ